MSNTNSHQSDSIARAEQAVFEHLDAGTLSLESSAVQTARADSIVAHLSALGQVQTERADAQASAVGALRAQQVNMHFSGVGAVQARQVSLSKGGAGVLVSDEVHVQGTPFVGVLLARHVTGSVRPLLDWRGALALGLVIGLFIKLAGWGKPASR